MRSCSSISAANQRVLLHRGRARCARSSRGTCPATTRLGVTADMNCEEFVELVTAYLDDALDERPGLGSRSTSPSARLRRYLDQFRDTIDLLGTLEPADLSAPAVENCGRRSAPGRADTPETPRAPTADNELVTTAVVADA